jgi:hypothetical protein
VDVDSINERHGTDFRSAGRYEGGEVGAQRLIDGAGRRFVLKQQPPGKAPATTDALRPLGYPVPRYVAWGDGYHVQDELSGRPAGDWGAASRGVTSRLLELNELQDGRAVDDDRSWPAYVAESVLVGFSEYAVVGTLERHSEATRELLALCRRAVARYADAIETRDDVVHWDFTLANVLVEGDSVTGVVDWSGTRSGDRLFDLATLVYYGREETDDLRRYVVQRIGEQGLSVYLAHMAVRQCDWSLRHHGRRADEDVVRYSLELIQRFT